MFSPSAHYNSGGHSGPADKDPIFFKDTEEEFYEPHNSYYTYPEEKHAKDKNINYTNNHIDNINIYRNPFGNGNNPKTEEPLNQTNEYQHWSKYNITNNKPKHSYYLDNGNTYEKSYNHNPFPSDQFHKINNKNNRFKPYQSFNNLNNKDSFGYDNFNRPQTDFESFGNSPGKYSFGKEESGSVTCVDTNDNTKPNYKAKDQYHTSIKINDSGTGTSIGGQKLLTARKQLVVKAYFKSFKILSLVTFLLFFCSIISTIVELSCISKDALCLPKFQIQSSGPIENVKTTNSGLFNAFRMQPVHRDPGPDLEENLMMIETFIDGISGMVLDSSFNDKLMKSKIGDVFENKNSVIYKFSKFGFCREITDEFFIETICHPYFSYGIDVPSVFLKDITYSLSLEEIDGDAEYVSNIFVANYRSLFHILKVGDYRDNEFLFYGFLSSVLSCVSSYFSIVSFIIDVGCLVSCMLMLIVFKSKANNSLSAYRNFLFESNLKRQIAEQKFKFVRLQGFLTVITILIWVCTIMRILGLVYEIIYILEIVNVLKELDLKLIEGIKVISSGSILDGIDVLLHLFISIGLTIFVVCKPWIIKVSI